jgi:hypothetical protein
VNFHGQASCCTPGIFSHLKLMAVVENIKLEKGSNSPREAIGGSAHGNAWPLSILHALLT